MEPPTHSGAADMSTARAPFCPHCGELAATWSVYREEAPPAHRLTRLSFNCRGCMRDVTLDAVSSESDGIGV